MVPVPSYQNVPTFGTGATLVQPIAGTYNGGFLPGQLFPAEYENWLMNGLSANGNTSQTSVLSITAELVNILTAASITPAPATNTQVKSALDILYAPFSEIAARQAADALLAPLAGATFTGPVIFNSTVSVQVATSAAQPYQKSQVDTFLALKAPLASPTFTGTVTIPTPVNPTDALQFQYVSITTQAFSGSMSGSQVDTLSSMAIGETKWVNVSRSASSLTSYALNTPASGSFVYQMTEFQTNGSSGIVNVVNTNGNIAANTALYTANINSGFGVQISVQIRRIS